MPVKSPPGTFSVQQLVSDWLKSFAICFFYEIYFFKDSRCLCISIFNFHNLEHCQSLLLLVWRQGSYNWKSLTITNFHYKIDLTIQGHQYSTLLTRHTCFLDGYDLQVKSLLLHTNSSNFPQLFSHSLIM